MQTATPKIQTLTYKLTARNFIFTVRPEVSSIASTNHFTIHIAFTIVITCFFTALLATIIALDYNLIPGWMRPSHMYHFVKPLSRMSCE